MTPIRHTVGTLVAAVSPDDLANGIRRLYWADQNKELDAYLELQGQPLMRMRVRQ